MKLASVGIFYPVFFTYTSLLSAAGYFEKNLGQANATVQYYIANASASVQFKSGSVEFLARSTKADESAGVESLRLSFPGAGALHWLGKFPDTQRIGYIFGAQRSSHDNVVPRYSRVVAQDIYPGIDLVFYLHDDKLEYDFVVHPKADASLIHIRFSGQTLSQSPSIDQFTTRIGGVPWVQKAPLTYQSTNGSTHTVPSRWQRESPQSYRLITHHYDKSSDLIVDPVIEFASYFGGQSDDEIVITGDGFVAGHTQSKLIEGTNGQFRRGRDIFVRLIANVNQSALIDPQWRDRTYFFGGSGDDTLVFASLVANPSFVGISIAGNTTSKDMPLGAGARYKGGSADGFVLRYSMDTFMGSFSSRTSGDYVGGSGEDRILAGTSGANFCVAGVTDSPDLAVHRAMQRSLAGKQDGFAGCFELNNSVTVFWMTYLGGSGADSATAIAMRNSPPSIVVGGETSSEEIAALPGTLAGASDGFVFTIQVPSLPIHPGQPQDLSIASAQRIAGSGRDRVTALALDATALYVAGETNSPDFATLHATQPALSGGTDGFLLAYNNSLELQFATYIGGSGDETVDCLQFAKDIGLFLGGSTTSADLQLMAPVQDTHKGRKDGFVTVLGLDGALRLSTYYGGSGDDIIRCLNYSATSPLQICGSTDSPDLPQVQPYPAQDRGGLDGFLAQIALPIVPLPALVYTTATEPGGVLVSVPQTAGLPLVQVRVKDPSIASLQFLQSSGAEITVLSQSVVRFIAKADRGQTEVEFLIEGFVAGRTTVKIGSFATRIASQPRRITGFVQTVSLTAETILVDPDSGAQVLSSSSLISLQPRDFQWKSSNPDVLSLRQTSRNDAEFRINSMGVAHISIDSPFPFFPEGGLPIEVEGGRLRAATTYANPLVESSVLFVPDIPLFSTGAFIGGLFRFESENPGLVLIRDNNGNFVSSYEVYLQGGQSIQVRMKALASAGQTRIRVSSPSLAADAFAAIQLTRLSVFVEAVRNQRDEPSRSFDLSVGQRLTLVPRFALEGENTFFQGSVSQDLMIETVSSNDAVATPSLRGLQSWERLTIVTVSTANEGAAQILFRTSSPHARAVSSIEIRVNNSLPYPGGSRQIYVGRRLQSGLPLPSGVTAGNVTATVSDPNIVALVSGADGTPNARVSFNANSPGNFPLLRAIAESGRTTLRIEFEGFQPVEFPVEVAPSGFAFVNDQLNLSLFHSQSAAQVLPYVLHPETLEPIEAQGFQTAFRVSPTFRAGSSEITISACPTFNLIANCSVLVTGVQPGSSFVEVNQIDGFVVPSLKSRLIVNVLPAFLAPGPAYAVKDAITSVSLNALLSSGGSRFLSQVDIDVSSLTPELILLSETLAGTPSPSIRMRTNGNFLIHGLAEGSQGRIRIGGSNLYPVELAVPVLGTSIALIRAEPSANTSEILLPGETRNYIARLTGAFGQSIGALRPSASPIPFRIELSAPDVVSVAVQGASSFSVTNLSRQVAITAKASGTSIITPSIGSTKGPPLPVTVRPRIWSYRSYMMPQGSSARITPTIEFGSPNISTDIAVTLRSLDPSKLLLSLANSTNPPTDSITVSQRSFLGQIEFIAKSLSSEGSTQIEISAPGTETSWIRVYHTSYGLQFGQPDQSTFTSGQFYRIPIFLAIVPRQDLPSGGLGMVPELGFSSDFNVAAIPIEFEIDNPELISIESPYPQLNSNPAAARPLRFGVRSAGVANITLKVPPGLGSVPGPGSSLRVSARAPN